MRTLLCSRNGRSRVLSRLIALCRKSAMDKWGLDPLYWSFVKVFIVQVHQLSLFEGTADTHMLYGRPISRVEVVGVVVRVKHVMGSALAASGYGQEHGSPPIT